MREGMIREETFTKLTEKRKLRKRKLETQSKIRRKQKKIEQAEDYRKDLVHISRFTSEELKKMPYEQLVFKRLAPLMDNLFILVKNNNQGKNNEEITRVCHNVLSTHMNILHCLDLLN